MIYSSHLLNFVPENLIILMLQGQFYGNRDILLLKLYKASLINAKKLKKEKKIEGQFPILSY